MRRVLASLAAFGLLVALVPVVAAAAPYKDEIHSTGIGCDFLEGAAGTVFFGVGVDDARGADAWLELWAGTPFEGPPDLTRDYESPVTATADATSLQASIPLVDENGDPAGTAEVAASLEPAGDPYPGGTFKDGNHLYRERGTFRPLAVTDGTLTIAGATYQLSGENCWGDRTDMTVFANQPNSFVSRYQDRYGSCDVTDGSNTGFIFIGLQETDWFWVDIGVYDGPDAPLSGYGEGTLTDGAGSADLVFWDDDGNEVATGSIDLTVLRSGERYNLRMANATEKRTFSGELLDFGGSLAIDGVTSFSLDGCVGFDGSIKDVRTFPRGPKPGGKVPSNDLPSGATTLKVGSRTSVATKGAAPDAEASFECEIILDPDSGETFEIPIGHTVWYKIAGTGGTVTVDTAGSDYDTVAAVYTSDGAGGWAPVPDACVDDVPLQPFGRTLQAAVSFPTTAGTWYHVQIGGYPESYTYGNLRVAVR